MPFTTIDGQRIHWEEVGAGPALVCLHSGWGRLVMPFEDAAATLSATWRMIFPDRLGYGRSEAIHELPRDFHAREARALGFFLGALSLAEPVLWGHSDGAIISALFAAASPSRPRALVLESIHFHRAKSRDFFARYAETQGALPPPVMARLEADHGMEGARRVVRMHSRVWLDFHEVGGDFYGDLLGQITCPTLVLHGASDPHTPVAEVEEVARRIPGARLAVIETGGHSPHSEPAAAARATEIVEEFLGSLGADRK